MKRAVGALGCLLLLPGFGLLPGAFVWLFLALSEPEYGDDFGVVWLLAELVLLGGGIVLTRHANRSLAGKVSRPQRLPSVGFWIWGWLLALIIGLMLARSLNVWGALFFPPVFVLAAAAPPLAAFAWALNSLSPADEGLSERQFVLALFCGATLSVALAVVLETLLPVLTFALVQGFFEFAKIAWEAWLDALAGKEVAQALSSYGFVLGMVQLAVIAPLVEELVKPLAVWPMLRQVAHRRQAFLIGAAAGAGFAVCENVLYAGLGANEWAGVTAVRALGAAVHPLGAGLVALACYELEHSDGALERRARRWLAWFGLAVGLHALWNGGIVLLVALTGIDFFGASPQVEILGTSEFGVLLALLALLGAAAWFGLRLALRALGEGPLRFGNLDTWTLLCAASRSDSRVDTTKSGEQVAQTERALALWALACLLAALSIGLAALQVLEAGG